MTLPTVGEPALRRRPESPPERREQGASSGRDARLAWVRRLGATSVAITFLLMVLGAWVKANGAGLACPDWPGCYGKFLPPFPSVENGGVYQGHRVIYTQAQELYEWSHRAVVALIIVPVAAFALATAWNRAFHPALRALPASAVAIYFVQAGLGAVTVVTGNPPWATTMHLATAVLWFGTLLTATAFAFLRPHAGTDPRAGTAAPAPAPRPPFGYVYPGEPISTPESQEPNVR